MGPIILGKFENAEFEVILATPFFWKNLMISH